WEIDVPKDGGESALAILALLNSGLKPDDPMIKNGLGYLRRLKSDQTYIRALQAMVLAEAALPEDKALLSDHVQWLLDARIVSGNRVAGWTYSDKRKELGGPDGSNTQYAVLALWAGKQGGIDIKKEIWEGIRQMYLESQDPAGTW